MGRIHMGLTQARIPWTLPEPVSQGSYPSSWPLGLSHGPLGLPMRLRRRGACSLPMDITHGAQEIATLTLQELRTSMEYGDEMLKCPCCNSVIFRDHSILPNYNLLGSLRGNPDLRIPGLGSDHHMKSHMRRFKKSRAYHLNRGACGVLKFVGR